MSSSYQLSPRGNFMAKAKKRHRHLVSAANRMMAASDALGVLLRDDPPLDETDSRCRLRRDLDDYAAWVLGKAQSMGVDGA